MSILQLFIIAAIAFLVGQLKNGRSLILLTVSAFIIYWLQPPQKNITFTYWLPTATLIITMLIWLLTSTPEARGWKQNFPALIVLSGVILLLDLNRYFQLEQIFSTTTPNLQWIVLLLAVILTFFFFVARFKEYPSFLFVLVTIGLIVLFILIKVPSALSILHGALSAFLGKEASGSIILSWLGFSYVSFRLLHTIFDRRSERLPSVPLADYVNYVIFFPSFVAGPIDR